MASLLLLGAIALLMVDSIIELSFLVTTVSWLHRDAGKGFFINFQGSQYLLPGKPLNFLLDQGHTSNGAAGCAFVVIGIGGLLALFLRSRQLKRNGGISGFTAFFYNAWLYMTAISAIFTIAAFVYVFTVTYTHTHQSIDQTLASQLVDSPYPRNTWTPQNWYPAVLDLDLATAGNRSDIKFHLAIMKGWQWNLIPMMLIGLAVAGLAFTDRMRHKQAVNKANGASRLEAAARRKETGSPYS